MMSLTGMLVSPTIFTKERFGAELETDHSANDIFEGNFSYTSIFQGMPQGSISL